MATEDDSEIPETGAVFTFGKSKFGDSAPNKFWIRDDKVHQICCGDEHTGIISESGKLFMFGSNEWGQLGLGHNKAVTKPSRVKALKSEKAVLLACGRSHTLAATESGKVFAFGNNGDGQCGLGDSNSQNVVTPAQVQLPTVSIRMMDAGNGHSVLLTNEGDVYVWGGGGEGQLGLGEDDEVYAPRKLNIGEKAVCISCGYYHTAIVTASGKLLTCGEAEGGKLGLGDSSDSVQIPTPVEGIHGKVVQVACGGSQTIAVTDNGKAYSFGDGANGQLGHGTMVLSSATPQQITSLTEKVTKACCGENHSALVTKRGALYTFGDGRHGKLALGDENFANQFKPCLVHRFKQFHVESVSCGGCHTLVCAKISHQNGDVGSGYESGEDQLDNLIGEPAKKTHLSKANHLYDSMDLEGSIGARNRRREKFPETEGTINRTLPPLSSTSMNRGSLPPLESTQKPPPFADERNALNPSNVPPIQKSHSATVHAAPKPISKEESEEDETESEEEESEEEKPARQQLDSTSKGRALPSPKPRPVPRKRLDPILDSKVSQKSAMDSPKIVKASAAPVHSKGRKMDESEDESEETESEEQEKDQKKSPKEKPKGKTKKDEKKKKKDSDEETESEEDTKKSKKSSPKPKDKKDEKKKKKDSDEETESEEDTKKSKKSSPKPKAKKEVPKKRSSIFGKKKPLESSEEEDSEEESEDEEERTKSKKDKKSESKKDDKKGSKKKKHLDSEDDDSEEETEDEGKGKSKKDKKKDSEKEGDTESKSSKKNSQKSDEKSDKKDDKKSKKNAKDGKEEEKSEEESEQSGVDEEAKSIKSDNSKDAEKDKGNEPQNPAPPKKSGTCAIL